MKRTVLKNIIKGILLENKENQDQVDRGNKVLDRANNKNVTLILKGELPKYDEDEVDRMQELAGIQNEVKVNNPNKLQMDYEEEDDDGEVKIISLSKDGEEWWGNENYYEKPGYFNVEFLIEDGEDNSYEQGKMDKLISLLNKNNIPYEIDNDNELKYISIPKDKLDLK